MAMPSFCWNPDCTNKQTKVIILTLFKVNVIINTFVCGRFHVQGTLLPKFTFPHSTETINCVILIQSNYHTIFEAQRD